MGKEYFSTTEAAKILGVNRATVFKKIKAEKIKAIKVGRNFIIHRKNLLEASGAVLNSKKKKEINKAVAKAIRGYSKTFSLLGKE